MSAAKGKAPGAAARAERNGKRTLEFEGLKLSMPAKLPFRMLKYAREPGFGATVGMLEVILGDEQLEKVWALDIDMERGEQLVNQILETYGLSLGE